MDTPLHTHRLLLRPCAEADIPAFLLALNDWEIAQWLPGPPFPYTEGDARDFIAATTRQSPPEAYAVCDRASGAFMGTLGLARTGSTAEMGYWLLKPFHGKGIMRQAIGCLLSQDHGDLRTIFATVDPANRPSIRLLEASSFKLVGEHRRDTPNRQGNIVVLRYELSLP